VEVKTQVHRPLNETGHTIPIPLSRSAIRRWEGANPSETFRLIQYFENLKNMRNPVVALGNNPRGHFLLLPIQVALGADNWVWPLSM
jgi:hypothetical protein